MLIIATNIPDFNKSPLLVILFVIKTDDIPEKNKNIKDV